jgi:hypothetical protein
MSEIKIFRVGHTEPEPLLVKPPSGGVKKTTKTYPRGILKKTRKASAIKVEGVRDPARAPPLRNATLRILTEKGIEHRRKKIRKSVRRMTLVKVRDTLKKAGFRVSDKLPENDARGILESGMEAGMIVAR